MSNFSRWHTVHISIRQHCSRHRSHPIHFSLSPTTPVVSWPVGGGGEERSRPPMLARLTEAPSSCAGRKGLDTVLRLCFTVSFVPAVMLLPVGAPNLNGTWRARRGATAYRAARRSGRPEQLIAKLAAPGRVARRGWMARPHAPPFLTTQASTAGPPRPCPPHVLPVQVSLPTCAGSAPPAFVLTLVTGADRRCTDTSLTV
jgi:hypothetical protein